MTTLRSCTRFLLFATFAATAAACSGGGQTHPDTGIDTGTTQQDTSPRTDATSDSTTPTDVVQTDIVGQDVQGQDVQQQDVHADVPHQDVQPRDGVTPGDPLNGTTWLSTTITASAASDGVTSSVYTINFNADGSFTGTWQVTYDSTNPNYPGCVATWALSGMTWTDDLTPTPPTFTIDTPTAGGDSTTTLAGCDDAQAAMLNLGLDGALLSGSTEFTITGTTLSANGNSGLPYSSADANENWVFTRQ